MQNFSSATIARIRRGQARRPRAEDVRSRGSRKHPAHRRSRQGWEPSSVGGAALRNSRPERRTAKQGVRTCCFMDASTLGCVVPTNVHALSGNRIITRQEQRFQRERKRYASVLRQSLLATSSANIYCVRMKSRCRAASTQTIISVALGSLDKG